MPAISQAAATQRAGRAGRTRPGRALRLYTRHDFEQRPRETEPEIARADLTEVALTLATLGVDDPDSLAWLDPAPAAAWGAARELLGRLGAVEQDGRLTDVGRRMSRLPVHPRLARLVVEGETRGVAAAAGLAAALIAERDIRLGARASFGGARPARHPTAAPTCSTSSICSSRQPRPASARTCCAGWSWIAAPLEEVDRARRQLATGGDRTARDAVTNDDEALRLAILAAFPDRVARRREPRARTVVFAAGGSAELGYEATGEWLVAVDAEERTAARGGIKQARTGIVEVRLGSMIEPEWLLDLYPERIEEVDRRAFDPRDRPRRTHHRPALRRADARRDRRARAARRGDVAVARRCRAGARPGTAAGRRRPARRLLAPSGVRPAPGARGVPVGRRRRRRGSRARRVRGPAAASPRSAIPPRSCLSTLPPDAQRALHTTAPERVTLASGRSVPIHYDAGDTPWIESRLQDFFGTRAVPAVGAGRVPLTVHLLAPNGRAVQVTRDLAGFWTQHYPALRRQLSRRYPRHPWPEDGATAKPPPPLPPRRPQK